MGGEKLSAYDRRKAQLAGAVVLRALELMPSGTITAVLLEMLDAGIHDPADRALFGFPPQGSGGMPPPDGFAGGGAAKSALLKRH